MRIDCRIQSADIPESALTSQEAAEAFVIEKLKAVGIPMKGPRLLDGPERGRLIDISDEREMGFVWLDAESVQT
jgi:hypothetical protein